VDVVFNLEDYQHLSLPFADDTFDRMLASHVLEHIHSLLPLLQELWRVAKPGCQFIVKVPHGGFDAAYEDPTHVRQFFNNSFLYFSQTAYGGADYGYRGDWLCERIYFSIMRKQETENPDQVAYALRHLRNICDEMTVLLTAVKPARAPGTGDYLPEAELRWSSTS